MSLTPSDFKYAVRLLVIGAGSSVDIELLGISIM